MEIAHTIIVISAALAVTTFTFFLTQFFAANGQENSSGSFPAVKRNESIADILLGIHDSVASAMEFNNPSLMVLSALEYVKVKYAGQILTSQNKEMIRIKFDEATISAFHSKVGRVPVFRIWAPWPDPKFRMKVFPETIPEDKKRMMGLQDIQLGNPEFDPLYIVQANNETELREVFTKDAQQALLELFPMDLNLSISRSGLNLEFVQEFKNRKDGRVVCLAIDQFVAAYNDMLQTHHGLRVFDVEYSLKSIAVCMICGDETADSEDNNAHSTVYCRNCNTPHHRDCWEFMGCCSTFACGETKFVASKHSALKTKPVVERTNIQ